jgi:hypothetical protein
VIDYASLGSQKRNLQAVADGAAVAAAREMVVTKATGQRVQAVADSYVAANYHGPGALDTAAVVEMGRAVEVTVSAEPKVYFPGPVGANAKRMSAHATAEVEGGGNVCMIGLDAKANSTINLRDEARLTASKCAIYSNSRSKQSLTVDDSARVQADLVCVAGGLAGVKSAIAPEPIEDCPPIADPLSSRPPPPGVFACDFTKTKITGVVGLKPGVYCDGIDIEGGTATLAPGVYIIKDGELKVTKGGTLQGDGAGFYLTGKASTITFNPDSHINLAGPTDGPLAGLLFFEDRMTKHEVNHKLISDDARRLVGTLYFPISNIEIDAKNPIADRSEYTVIIANGFLLSGGPELVLKTDYGASPVPLPDGVGNKAHATVRLAK